MRSATQSQQLVRRSLSPLALSPLAALGLSALLWSAGCDRPVLDAPTGQPVESWQDPFDRDAVRMAMPYYLSDDLSGYNFSVLLFIQNYNKSRFAVTPEVNGQEMDRLYVAGETQEVVQITNDLVLQSEATLGLSSTATDARLGGKPTPFLVRLKNYVSEDGYIIQNTNFVLAPQNFFESMVTDTQMQYNTNYTLDGFMVAPVVFALVVKDDHVDVIELDREFFGLNETSDTDPGLDIYTPPTTPTAFQFHPQTTQALTLLGLNWLIADHPGDVTQN